MRNKSWIIPVILFTGALVYGIVETVRLGPGVYWMPIGIVGLSFTLVYFLMFAPMLRNRRILKTGESGSARVLRMFETGVTVNNNPMVKLELEVTPQRGATYVTMTKVLVSRLNPMAYGPGTVVAVKIDTKDQTQVVIDPSGNRGGLSSARSGEFGEHTERRNAAMQELLEAADKMRTELLVHGKDAEGTIASLWSLNVNVNNAGVGMEFLVEVDIPGRMPFKTEIKGAVANANVGRYHIGARVKLKYDPVDPEKRIAIVGVAG